MRERGFVAAWRFYRRHFVSVFTLSLAFYAGMVALAAASVAGFGWFAGVALLYLMVASIFWQQAPLARLLDDVRAKRPHAGIRRTLDEISPRLGSITGGSAVAAIAVVAASAFLLLPGLVVLTRLALFVPVIVLEGRGAFASFGRSHRLLRGHAPRVFLELCISTVLMLVVWTIAWILLTATTLWISVPLTILFLALVTPPVPLMRVLSYYDLVEAVAKEEAEAAAAGLAVPVG
jgi:hypothetical protein